MALLTCINCSEPYSETLSACPHCGFVPHVFLCPECGGIHGPADLSCRTCGYQLNGSRIIADKGAIRAALEKASADLDGITSLRQADKTLYTLGILAQEEGTTPLLERAQEIYRDLQWKEEQARRYVQLTAAQPQSPAELTDLIALGESMGEYKDAAQITDNLRMQLNEHHYLAAQAKKDVAKTPGDWQATADAFAALGDYRDAAQQCAECQAQQKAVSSKKKKKTVTIVSICAAALVVIALVVSSVLFFIPNHFYTTGIALSDEGRYGEAAESFMKAGNYQDAPAQAVSALKAQAFTDGEAAFAAGDFMGAREFFLAAEDHPEAAQRAEDCILADHHAQGCALLEQGSFQEALDQFELADGYGDSAEKAKDACYGLADSYAASDPVLAVETFCIVYDHKDAAQRATDIADGLRAEGKYALAATAYDAIPGGDSESYAAYCRGQVAFLRGDYADAALQFRQAGSVENTAAMLSQSVYLQGLGLLKDKDFQAASVCFESVGKYEDAQDLLTVCQAELKLAEGHLGEGLKLYNSVPDGLTVDGFDIQERIRLVNGASRFADVCGKWTVTKNYIESRCHYRFGSRWWNWYIDYPVYEQYLEIKCYLNNDGTVRMDGTIYFYRFTNYSSYSDNCLSSACTKTFSRSGLTSVPYSIEVDYATKLTWGNGFQLKYSVRDEGTADFYYMYNSDVTYGKRSTAY